MALDVDEDGRVVDQNIDAAECFHRFGCHAVGIFFLRNIDLERQCLAAFRANLLGDSFAVKNIGDDDRGAFFRQAPAVCRADMARAAGDDGNSAAQPHNTLRE